MTQEHVWEREYKSPTFLTKENKPQADVLRFFHFLKKEYHVSLDRLTLLDLGCGTGRNSFYASQHGAEVTGYEISQTALALAEKNARNAGLRIRYKKQSIGEPLPVTDESMDILLDVTSSNSLTEAERAIYLSEASRVLRQEGFFFVKALCKDGDNNAKYLIKHNPGTETDTYVMPETGIVERVWTRQGFIDAYSKYFNILHLEKKTSYTKMNSVLYKRNFWICYMTKKA
jgi:ubiquinone/menaquinone biosynthesis C-methylase UbiE